MKKIITISMAVVFALAFGFTFAGSSMAMDRWDNGITVFAAGSVPTEEPIFSRGSGLESGIVLSRAEDLTLANGVTLFAAGPISTEPNYEGGLAPMYSAEGSAAGGYEEPAMDPRNGVTIFDEHAVDAD